MFTNSDIISGTPNSAISSVLCPSLNLVLSVLSDCWDNRATKPDINDKYLQGEMEISRLSRMGMSRKKVGLLFKQLGRIQLLKNLQKAECGWPCESKTSESCRQKWFAFIHRLFPRCSSNVHSKKLERDWRKHPLMVRVWKKRVGIIMRKIIYLTCILLACRPKDLIFRGKQNKPYDPQD